MMDADEADRGSTRARKESQSDFLFLETEKAE